MDKHIKVLILIPDKKKISIRVDSETLDLIDKIANKKGISRTALLLSNCFMDEDDTKEYLYFFINQKLELVHKKMDLSHIKIDQIREDLEQIKKDLQNGHHTPKDVSIERIKQNTQKRMDHKFELDTLGMSKDKKIRYIETAKEKVNEMGSLMDELKRVLDKSPQESEEDSA